MLWVGHFLFLLDLPEGHCCPVPPTRGTSTHSDPGSQGNVYKDQGHPESVWADYMVCVTLAPLSVYTGRIWPDYMPRAALGTKEGLGQLEAGM